MQGCYDTVKLLPGAGADINIFNTPKIVGLRKGCLSRVQLNILSKLIVKAGAEDKAREYPESI